MAVLPPGQKTTGVTVLRHGCRASIGSIQWVSPAHFFLKPLHPLFTDSVHWVGGLAVLLLGPSMQPVANSPLYDHCSLKGIKERYGTSGAYIM